MYTFTDLSSYLRILLIYNQITPPQIKILSTPTCIQFCHNNGPTTGGKWMESNGSIYNYDTNI